MNWPDKHQTCGLDGCSFTAAAKSLETHILHMHSSGLYNRVHQGNTREDIAKWRAERKKWGIRYKHLPIENDGTAQKGKALWYG